MRPRGSPLRLSEVMSRRVGSSFNVRIKINGKLTCLASEGFTLGPGETGELDYGAGGAPTFYAVGK